MKGLSRFNTAAGIEPAIAIFLERIQTIYSINYTFIQCLSLSKTIPILCPHSTVTILMISKQAVNHTEIRHFERFGLIVHRMFIYFYFDYKSRFLIRFLFLFVLYFYGISLFKLSFIYSLFCVKTKFRI